jgi:hypothetical protein
VSGIEICFHSFRVELLEASLLMVAQRTSHLFCGADDILALG